MVLADQTAMLAQRKADWLEARKSVITATQAATIWVAHHGGFLHKGSQPLDIWLEKRGEAPEFDGNLHTWVGNAMERPIAEWVASELGAELEFPEPYTLVHSKRFDWLACTPDAYAVFADGHRELIECKTAAGDESEMNAKWGPSGSCVVPFNYLSQVTYQLAALEVGRCHLGAALWMASRGYGGKLRVVKDRRRYPIMRIPIIENEMLKVIGEWVQRHMVKGVPPKTYSNPGRH